VQFLKRKIAKGKWQSELKTTMHQKMNLYHKTEMELDVEFEPKNHIWKKERHME
jgi:hypothetical protein